LKIEKNLASLFLNMLTKVNMKTIIIDIIGVILLGILLGSMFGWGF